MKMVKKVVSSLLMLFMMFAFVACNRSDFSKGTKATNSETNKATIETKATGPKYTIGWSVYNSAYEFFKAMQEGVLAEANELGINVITHDQKGSTLEMIIGATNLIKEGIDALVISPINPEAMIIIVKFIKRSRNPRYRC